jgi:hypothetical protein
MIHQNNADHNSSSNQNKSTIVRKLFVNNLNQIFFEIFKKIATDLFIFVNEMKVLFIFVLNLLQVHSSYLLIRLDGGLNFSPIPKKGKTSILKIYVLLIYIESRLI